MSAGTGRPFSADPESRWDGEGEGPGKIYKIPPNLGLRRILHPLGLTDFQGQKTLLKKRTYNFRSIKR